MDNVAVLQDIARHYEHANGRVRLVLRLLKALSPPLQAILCTVGYVVPSNFAASINEITLPSPAMTSSIIFGQAMLTDIKRQVRSR